MLGMSVRGFAMLVATTALLGAACGAAQAAPAGQVAGVTPGVTTKPLDFTVQPDSLSAIPGGQAMKLDAAKNRWGVTLSVHQPDTRQSTLNDIQAGAYYKITPALRVGGAFAFGSEQVAATKDTVNTTLAPGALDRGRPRRGRAEASDLPGARVGLEPNDEFRIRPRERHS